MRSGVTTALNHQNRTLEKLVLFFIPTSEDRVNEYFRTQRLNEVETRGLISLILETVIINHSNHSVLP